MLDGAQAGASTQTAADRIGANAALFVFVLVSLPLLNLQLSSVPTFYGRLF